MRLPVLRIFSLLIGLALPASADSPVEFASLLVPGDIISRTAPGETGISFHVYVPSNYEAEASSPPMLIAFSPGGDGKSNLKRLKEGVEDAGWLLVGCDKLRNHLNDRELALKIEDEVLRSLPEGHTKAMLLTGPAVKLTAEYYGSKLAWLRQYEEAKDLEVFTNGLNTSDTPLLREAHRLLWNDSKAPSEMTEEERQLFVKALTWIHQFYGHQQSVFRGTRTRDVIFRILDDPNTDQETLIRLFPKSLLEQYDYQSEKLREHFSGKLGYVHAPFGGGLLRIDKEAELLGVPNNDPSSIEIWIAALKGEQKKQAQSLLLRYTHQRIRGNPAQWTAWYEKHKDSLEFRDDRGYRFYVSRE